MIRSIVGRLHVSQSYLEVVRYVRTRLRRGSWQNMPHKDRREFIRICFEAHASNRAVYDYVYPGSFPIEGKASRHE